MKIRQFKFNKEVPAIWNSNEYDIPIVLIGFYFDNKKIYFKIKDSNTCISFDEVEFENIEDFNVFSDFFKKEILR